MSQRSSRRWGSACAQMGLCVPPLGTRGAGLDQRGNCQRWLQPLVRASSTCGKSDKSDKSGGRVDVSVRRLSAGGVQREWRWRHAALAGRRRGAFSSRTVKATNASRGLLACTVWPVQPTNKAEAGGALNFSRLLPVAELKNATQAWLLCECWQRRSELVHCR